MVLTDFDAKLAGNHMDAASRRTYIKFLKQLPLIASGAYTVANIADGWEKTGVWPLNFNRMLNQNPAFNRLPAPSKLQIVDACITLADFVASQGRIPDKVMHNLLGPILLNTAAQQDTRDFDRCPLNYQRTVLVTHQRIITFYKKRRTKKCIQWNQQLQHQ